MKTLRFALGSPSRLASLAMASVCLSFAPSLHAADIYLVTDGAFAGTGGWSDGQAPVAGNNYFSSGFRVVTPNVGTSQTFAGDSLSLLNGAVLEIRQGNAATIVNDLRINNSFVRNTTGFNPALQGNVTITGFASFNPTLGRNLRITAVVGGTGEVRARAGVVTLLATNTYSGGTLVETDATYPTQLLVQRDGALGTGNLTVQSGSLVTFSGGVTHNYVADSASLLFASGLAAQSITLSYLGTDVIGGLSFDGGTTWAASGTWGAIGSGADNESNIFAGTGFLNVSAIPEPSTTAALAASLALISAVACKRRARSSVS